MKKLLVIAGAITGAALLSKVLLFKRWASGGGVDFGRMVENMPEGAPPKWIFRNVTAIRENTERILELLDSERTSAEG